MSRKSISFVEKPAIKPDNFTIYFVISSHVCSTTNKRVFMFGVAEITWSKNEVNGLARRENI